VSTLCCNQTALKTSVALEIDRRSSIAGCDPTTRLHFAHQVST